ncbi:MAG: CsgG/HfaB family protein [Acidobacteriota bacterium]
MRLASKLLMLFAVVGLLMQLGSFAPVYAQRKGEVKDDGKPKVIVAGDAASSASWTQEITLAELETAMVQSGRFTVLSRSSLDQILSEQRLAQSDLADPGKATAVGKLLTARYAIIGKCVSAEEKESGGGAKIGGFGSVGGKKKEMNVVVKIQLIDVETSQIVNSQEYKDTVKIEGKSGSANVPKVGTVGGGGDKELPRESAYREMVKKWSSDFVSRISSSAGGSSAIVSSIEGLVVAVRGNEVAIDKGNNASVKEGMVFEVFTEGEPIRNAAGEILSRDKIKHGRIKIVRVEEKLAWGEILRTFDDKQSLDPTPNPDRIKRDYSVRQAK